MRKRLLLLALCLAFAPSLASGCGQTVSRQIYTTSFSTEFALLQDFYFDREVYPPVNLRSITEKDWIVPDAEYAEQIAMKKKIERVRSHKTILTSPDPDIRAASKELLALIVSSLTTHYPRWFTRDGSRIHCSLTNESVEVENPTEHPLKVAAFLVQEDMLLVRTGEDGIPRLVAGSVHFPTGWELHHQMGYSISEIHGGVTNYESIDSKVNALVTRLRPDLLFSRNNWFISADPTHAQPGDRRSPFQPGAVTKANAGETLFLRSERETFRKLPESGFVLFTIKPHVYPLQQVAQFPAVAAKLVRAIANAEPHQCAYPKEATRYLGQFAKVARPLVAPVVGVQPQFRSVEP